MRSYEAARGSFSLFEMLARLIIAVGILAAVGIAVLASESMGRNVPPPLAAALGAVPGGLIALAGFFGLAMAQMGRATVDSAEYAQQALSVSRQQLELSQQMLEQGKVRSASYRSASPVAATTHAADCEPSYADQSVVSPASDADQPSEQSAQLIETQASKSLETEEHVQLPRARLEISYQDGSYLVGDQPFPTRKAAQQYLEMLALAGPVPAEK